MSPVTGDGPACRDCGAAVEWRDCDRHPDVECYATVCDGCGRVDRDCADRPRMIAAARLLGRAVNHLEAADHPEISTHSRAALRGEALASARRAEVQVSVAAEILETFLDRVTLDEIGREEITTVLELLVERWHGGERWE